MSALPVEIRAADLRAGDRIVTKTNRDGTIAKTEKVREIDNDARGCRNVHVNGNQCWDRAGFVQVAP